MSNLHMGGGVLYNKNVKAFTLIELLAVIVILAIIAIIATPIILGIIGDSKEKAFRLSLKNVEHAYSLYVAQHQEDTNFDKSEEISVKELPLNSNLSGVVFTNEEGKIELKNITDGTYSASGTMDDLNIIKGNIDELLKNILTIKVNTNPSSKNILITVEVLEGVPTSYTYKIEGPNNYSMESKNKTTNTHTFDKLKPNTEYIVVVTVKNKAGLTKEITRTIKTLTIENITLDLTPKDEYIKEGKVTINYPSIEEGQVNQYKWEDDEDFTPVSGNSIEVDAQNGTLIAVILDGEEVVTTNQITINNIDNVPPVITLSTVQKTTNSITIPFSVEEDHIGEVTCKYSDKANTYTSNGTVGESACTLSNELKDNKTYYYQICVTDLAGNGPVCETGSTNTEEITNPEVNITHTPTTAGASTTNGYSYKEVANITFTSTNITNPTYYIKSTMSGTTNENVIGSCTEEDSLPKTCTNISITNIISDTWYKVSGDINITYNTETETPITVYAVTYDGKNFSTSSTGTTLKIDRTGPTFEVSVEGMNATITAEDPLGLHAVAYNCNGTWQESNICAFTTYGEYTINVRDALGNEGEAETIEISKLELVRVVYDEDQSAWKIVSDTDASWSDYEHQKWGNAVLLKSGVSKSIGKTVTVEGENPDVIAMFVWIPRYEYKIEGTYGTHSDRTAGTKDLPGEIEVQFINKTQKTADTGYIIHPAFTFGGEELDGIWVGKFETSHTTLSASTKSNNLGCSDNNCENADGLRILPNVESLRYNNVKNFFYAAQSMGNRLGIDGDLHMMKNSEWGAAAYLSQSKYGKYGNTSYSGAAKEVTKNANSSYKTGGNDYKNNTAQSTTGNITGIYDMSGGATEYVMGVYNEIIGNSGFTTLPDAKYYDNYTSTTATTACKDENGVSGICYGHALSETARWYGDNVYFIESSGSWFLRGLDVSSEEEITGVFGFGHWNGESQNKRTFRVVLTPDA